MADQPAKRLLGHQMVSAQLGTAVGMGVSTDTIHTLRFHRRAFGFDRFRDPVYAADRRNDPDFVADPDTAIGADIALKDSRFLSTVHGCSRMIGVFPQPFQVGFDVMGMDMLSRADIRFGMADGEAVFDDIDTFGNISQRDLVAGRDLFQTENGKPFQVHRCSGRNCLQGHGDIITVVDSDKLLHTFLLPFIRGNPASLPSLSADHPGGSSPDNHRHHLSDR